MPCSAAAVCLQALCDERGSSLNQANLQLEMLTQKVQLLTAELNQQEQDTNDLVRDLQSQLLAAQAKQREYQAAEGVLDQAILGAVAAGELGLVCWLHVAVWMLPVAVSLHHCRLNAAGASTRGLYCS